MAPLGEAELVDYRPAAYSTGVAPTLYPLTLRVEHTDHVALVGRSGAGKSTLLSGLARLLPVAAGTLSLDGWESRRVPLYPWRRAIKAIPQEPLVLAGSVLHNLDPTGLCTEEQALEALRLAGLDELVADLPNGLHTPLARNESGGGSSVELSGGHRQLLALARLLLRREEARLVLLDEPAAGMQESASARLHAVVNEQLVHTTLLAVTHRLLPLLHLFSRVVVLERGACVEDGAPAALLAKSGGRLHRIFEQAPPRMRAHVRRMIALHRSKGLHAVRGLWESANLRPAAESPASPSASPAKEAKPGAAAPPSTTTGGASWASFPRAASCPVVAAAPPRSPPCHRAKAGERSRTRRERSLGPHCAQIRATGKRALGISRWQESEGTPGALEAAAPTMASMARMRRKRTRTSSSGRRGGSRPAHGRRSQATRRRHGHMHTRRVPTPQCWPIRCVERAVHSFFSQQAILHPTHRLSKRSLLATLARPPLVCCPPCRPVASFYALKTATLATKLSV